MGPLAGVKIVEFTGIGPAPMAAMMLADMGATIIRIDRTGPADLGIPMPEKFEFTKRSRAVIGLDLKQPASIQLALRLIDGADALIEGFRPGVLAAALLARSRVDGTSSQSNIDSHAARSSATWYGFISSRPNPSSAART